MRGDADDVQYGRAADAAVGCGGGERVGSGGRLAEGEVEQVWVVGWEIDGECELERRGKNLRTEDGKIGGNGLWEG